jgi:dipeptidyl aminopeptidase/acylaminoacyl peptidase
MSLLDLLEPALLAPDSLFDLTMLRDADVSGRGANLAYCVSTTSDGEEQFAIWVSSSAGGPRRLPFAGKATAPRWSPDGQRLAFIGDGQLRVAAWPSLELGEPLSPADAVVEGVPSWAPDSEQLAVSLVRHRRTTGVRVLTERLFLADGIGFVGDYGQSIHLLSCLGGDGKQLTLEEDGLCSQPRWSPCGRRIFYFVNSQAIPNASYSPKLAIADLHTGSASILLDRPWYLISAQWLSDGRQIAIAASPDDTLTIPNTRLWTVDLSGKATMRSTEAMGKVGGLLHHDMPCWELTRRNPIHVLDSDTALVTTLRRGAYEIWRVALDGDLKAEPLLSGERSCIVLCADLETDTLLFATTDLVSPPEICCATIRGDAERQLTQLNRDVLAHWPKFRIEAFTYPSGDGYDIDCWFLALEAAGGPLPSVLFIHGGPFASTGHAFRYDFLLLAAQGFGVIFANFRGSAGYGDSFSRAIMGDWGARGFPDHMGAVDAAIVRGYTDPERLGVWGPSHGGFATCWIVGHTDRFKAAVAEAAPTNLATNYYLSDAPDTKARDLGGRPHEIPDAYRARSPITYAHRCTTPTMFIHGEDDRRVPISEAEQFYRILHDVGCPAEMVRITDCHHLGDSCGPLAARQAQNEALVRWFRRYL